MITAVVKWFVAFLLTLLAVALLSDARADVLRGDKGSCAHFSQLIQGFGINFRDQGASWGDLEPTWARMVADALASEKSYVRNNADAEWVTQKAQGLWATKDPAILYAANVFEECMRVPSLKRVTL